MRSREYYWSLFHTLESNQLDNLRTDQVEAVFAAIPKRTLNEWLIWRDGFDKWKPLEDFPQLLVSLRKVEQQVPVVPPPPKKSPGTQMATAAKKPAEKNKVDDRADTISDVVDLAADDSGKAFVLSDTDEVDLSFEAVSSSEERNNFRFNKVFDVRIIAGSQIFHDKTVNISLRGMQLVNPLPPGLPRYFNVEVKHREQTIQMVCSAVKNPNGSPGTRIKIEMNDFTSGLLAMLLSA